MDMYRCHMIHGFVVPRNRIGFTQLSNDGEAFAASYSQGEMIKYG